jgi:hypothetical protein
LSQRRIEVQVVRRLTIGVAVLAAVLFAEPRTAGAQPIGLFAKIAFDPSIGGTMHSSGSGIVNGASLSLSEQSWTDTHTQQSPLFVGGIHFTVAPGASALVGFEYGRAGADTTTLGTAGGQDIRAEFDSYQYWGLQGGLRAGGRTGPYGTAMFGFRHVNEIQVTTNVAGLAKADFYKASNVPSFGFGGGYMFGFIGVEVMAQYAGGLTASRSAPALFQTVADDGARWSLPISLVVGF